VKAIADGQNFLEAVRDVNNAHAVRPHPPDQIEQRVDLPLGEAGCGFVHDNHPRLEGHRLSDLHQLLLGGGKPGYGQARIQIRSQGLEQFGAETVHFRGILEPAPRGFAAQKNIVRHVQVGAKVELLVNERHAILSRVPSIGQGGRLASDSQLAPVRRDDAAQIFIMVLLPAPFSPTNTCTSPGKTSKSTSSRIFTSVLRSGRRHRR
jgi:hypothetical protein